MSTPIFQLCIYKNNGALWELFMSLPEEKRKDLIEKEEASRKTLGVKNVVGCFSSWADEERPYWTILRYPSLDVRIQHTRRLQEIGMIAYNSYWCNEAYPNFGVDVYPNIEANMKMMQALEALGWKQSRDSFTLLGIPQQEME